ncbi:hypothetical protein G0Q06_00935 [Puniceicoccales bacterium CK1056]|uniref:Choice-of-anchor A family protein n=1 Tax=Oceanipulchritudo coccoides TaxID=2706888 RepID=A0A6B2LZ08_9BACT|nr:hypothetical protein [Oceanipulchritudo coccoides]NDV61007.1 hypothetical protein [Oceanipulchritudo coccoides]
MKNTILHKTSIIASFGLGMCLLASSTSAQYTYIGNDPDIVLDGNGFTGAAGETLDIGTTGDVGGRFDTTMTDVVGGGTPYPIVSVYGSSTLTASGVGYGGDPEDMAMEKLTVNISDTAEFLVGVELEFRNQFVLNYDSSADSVSSGSLRLLDQAAAEKFTSFNLNSGSLTVGPLRFGEVSDKGQINLNGGDFTFATLNDGDTPDLPVNAQINFADPVGAPSVLTITEATGVDYLDEYIANGLFAIQGVPVTSLSAYNLSWTQTGTITVVDPITLEETIVPIGDLTMTANALQFVTASLEMSTDLQNWNPVDPGDFQITTTPRFFRAVVVPVP